MGKGGKGGGGAKDAAPAAAEVSVLDIGFFFSLFV